MSVVGLTEIPTVDGPFTVTLYMDLEGPTFVNSRVYRTTLLSPNKTENDGDIVHQAWRKSFLGVDMASPMSPWVRQGTIGSIPERRIGVILGVSSGHESRFDCTCAPFGMSCLEQSC
ncbi:hypothetical protein QQP08_025633 [Theobroma cacao]|nr:hypothetical protein QQP08_025633 [Theobroma cacao]